MTDHSSKEYFCHIFNPYVVLVGVFFVASAICIDVIGVAEDDLAFYLLREPREDIRELVSYSNQGGGTLAQQALLGPFKNRIRMCNDFVESILSRYTFWRNACEIYPRNRGNLPPSFARSPNASCVCSDNRRS